MDTALGLLGLLLYITFVLSLSSAVTFAVVKLSPAQSAKETPKDS